MSTSSPLTIIGMPGSPYSRKLRAILRYRRIPYAWIVSGSPEHRGLPRPRVELLPQILVPGEDGNPQALTDTSPILRRLEKEYRGREVLPTDPVLAFLDLLIEDYADEWLTKAMFHYRWAYEADIRQAAAILPRWAMPDRDEAFLDQAGDFFSRRQIERLAVVGSNPETAPIIEASYRRLLEILDPLLTGSRFILGGRPGAGDFGLYGQLTQLAGFDPTSHALALTLAPRVVAWVDLVEDLSGLNPNPSDWLPRDQACERLRPLLAEIGRTYVPFLLANAEALSQRADTVACDIDGARWTQKPFPYQGKCLTWLREAHTALSPSDRDSVAPLLRATGCHRLFVSA